MTKRSILILAIVFILIALIIERSLMKRELENLSLRNDSLSVIIQNRVAVDKVTVRPILLNEGSLELGDTLIADIVAAAEVINESKPGYITIVRNNHTDTIPAEFWNGQVKIKTDKIGWDTLSGTLHIPFIKGEYIGLGFTHLFNVKKSSK